MRFAAAPMLLRAAGTVLALLLAACAGTPPTPDWQMNAQDSMRRSLSAYLSGDPRVAALEFDRARAAIARTGRPELLARAELMRCAAQVASLVLEACSGFEALRVDAAAPERVYADYLAGRPVTQDRALLAEPHRTLAAVDPAASEAVLQGIPDPLSQLVAAGVLFRTGRAGAPVAAAAVDAASTQGWRRPLLAWLGVQLRRADAAGATAEAERLRRRIELVLDPPTADAAKP